MAVADSSGRVWVLDTSALICFKQLVPVTGQWDAFKHLEELVRAGTIAMPRQVIKEAQEIAHPDLPGAWAPGVRRELQHPLTPDDRYIIEVMNTAGDVVDAQSDKDDADPWVCALALHLRDLGFDPVVVTEDIVDRLPKKIALATACARLGIETCSAKTFLETFGIKTRKDPGAEDSSED